MTQGKDASLESYRRKTAFSHVMSHVLLFFLNSFGVYSFPLGLNRLIFYYVSKVRVWVRFLGRASVRARITDIKSMSRDNFYVV